MWFCFTKSSTVLTCVCTSSSKASFLSSSYYLSFSCSSGCLCRFLHGPSTHYLHWCPGCMLFLSWPLLLSPSLPRLSLFCSGYNQLIPCVSKACVSACLPAFVSALFSGKIRDAYLPPLSRERRCRLVTPTPARRTNEIETRNDEKPSPETPPVMVAAAESMAASARRTGGQTEAAPAV